MNFKTLEKNNFLEKEKNQDLQKIRFWEYSRNTNLEFNPLNLNLYLKKFCLVLLDLDFFEMKESVNQNLISKPSQIPVLSRYQTNSKDFEERILEILNSKSKSEIDSDLDPNNDSMFQTLFEISIEKKTSLIEQSNFFTVQIFNYYENNAINAQFNFLQRNQILDRQPDKILNLYNQYYFLLAHCSLHIALLQSFVTQLTTQCITNSLLDIHIFDIKGCHHLKSCRVRYSLSENQKKLIPTNKNKEVFNFGKIEFEFVFFDLKDLLLKARQDPTIGSRREVIQEFSQYCGFDFQNDFGKFCQSLENWYEIRKRNIFLFQVVFENEFSGFSNEILSHNLKYQNASIISTDRKIFLFNNSFNIIILNYFDKTQII